MRVDDGNGIERSLGRVQETRAAEFDRKGASGLAPVTGEDRVDLSNLASRVSGALEAGAADRGARVRQLAREVSSGRYAVDGAAVARALVSQAIGSPRGTRESQA